ncbi:hypothetical protein [uncultured Roseivirga sp.]|uniref:hypothetical protein n=1 Tax=uncultured Roseivirga sp. TaxID=543088 RepID=UPI0030D8B9AB|tara:strand:+ start:3664 stop:3861 length:198 start_codon:yes stop_codon:yes gene_type:complete
MKRLYLILGILFSLIGLINLIRFAFDYSILSDYGKGFIWGNSILLVFGIGFMVLFFSKRTLKEEY